MTEMQLKQINQLTSNMRQATARMKRLLDGKERATRYFDTDRTCSQCGVEAQFRLYHWSPAGVFEERYSCWNHTPSSVYDRRS